MRLFLIAAALLGALTQAAVAAQTPSGHSTPDPSPTAYEQLLARYAGGDFDSVAGEVASQPANGFAAALEKVRDRAAATVARQALLLRDHAIPPTTLDRAVDDQLRLLLSAMLLHVEAALQATNASENGRDDWVEGHLKAGIRAGEAFETASRYISLPQTTAGCLSRPDAHRILHDWSVLTVAVMHARSHLGGLPAFVIEALARDPKDPDLSLGLGVYYERAAGGAILDESLMRDIYPASAVTLWRHTMEVALSWLSLARANAAWAPETHLRAGRIEQLLGESKAARAELEPLLEPSAHPTPAIRYLALMLAGRLDQADKQAARAATRYQAALDLFPSAQAAMLAMSQLHDQSGAGSDAVTWLNRSFGSAHLPVRRDPWWAYGNGPLWDTSPLLPALRKELRR